MKPGVLSFNTVNPSTFNANDEDPQAQPSSLFYDKNSRKIIAIHHGTSRLKILNKDATNIKCDITLPQLADPIKFITIDKDLCYMLITTERCSKNESISNVIILDIAKEQIVSASTLENHFLLGNFFIDQTKLLSTYASTDENNNNNSSNRSAMVKHFVLMFAHKITIHGINTVTNEVPLIESMSIPNTKLIKDFSYCSKYKILCVWHNNGSFTFYNFNKRKFYTKAYPYVFDCIKLDNKQSSGFFSRFSKPNPNELLRIKDVFFNRDKYTMTQIYLEELYNTLFFICLSFEDLKIYFYEIKSLTNIEEKYVLNYEHFKFSTCQFTDNLTVIHNFLLKRYVVIDVKSSEFVISTCEMAKFGYDRNTFVNGEVFEERNIQMQGVIVHKVQFNAVEYWKDSQNNKCNALLTLLRRRNSKDICIRSLREMICNRDNCSDVYKIFKEIVKQLKRSTPIAKLTDDMLMNQNNLYDNASELPGITDALVSQKKNTIKQSDIVYSLFKWFDKEDVNEQVKYDVVIYMVNVYLKMKVKGIIVDNCYCDVLMSLIKKFKADLQLHLYLFLFDNKILPQNVETAMYLYKISKEGDCAQSSCERRLCAIMAMDIVKRVKRFDLLVEWLFEKKMYMKGWTVLSQHHDALDKTKVRKILKDNIAQLKEWKCLTQVV